MGLRDIPTPETSPLPAMSLAEARRRGLDVRKVRTCAVTEVDQGNKPVVLGCPKGKHCAQAGFGTPGMGGFGPHSDQPGTGGEGPENVPYSHYDIGSSTLVEGFMPCAIFMQTMMDKMQTQDATGDRLVILGREGKTNITIFETLPDPKTMHLPVDQRSVKETSRIIDVPVLKGAPSAASARLAHVEALHRNRAQQIALQRRDALGHGVPAEDVAEDAAEDAEQPAEEVVDVTNVSDADLEGGEQETAGALGGIEKMEVSTSARRVNRAR